MTIATGGIDSNITRGEEALPQGVRKVEMGLE